MRIAGHLGRLVGHLVPERTKRRFQADFAHLEATGEYPNQREHPAFVERQLTRSEIAAASLGMINSTFHPVQAVERYAGFARRNYPGVNVQQYREQYIQGKNVLLRELLSPILITERHSVPQQNAGEHALCSGCSRSLPVDRIRLVGAERPEDLSLRMTATQPEPTVVVAESPIGAVRETTITSVDIHQLTDHPESDDAMRVVSTLSDFEPFFSAETTGIIEYPAFLPKLPGQQ